MGKIVFRVAEALVVGSALAVLFVRFSQGDSYREYCRSGGRNGFWQWFAKERCGFSLPGADDRDVQFAAEAEEQEQKGKKAAQAERDSLLAELEKREKALVEAEVKERNRLEAVRRMLASKRGGKSGKTKKSDKGRSFGGSGGKVKVGGASSYQARAPGQVYRVNGIRGIEFGSTDNAPAEGVRPLLSVSYDADGNAEFRQLKWREKRALSDKIYGFDTVYLDHTYDSGQLSEITMYKTFPMTEEGARAAMDFYASMSGEAAQDLGFDLVSVDRLKNTKSASICEFRNGDGDTAIRGAVDAWSDKTLSVTLKVVDKGFAKMQREQSLDAYERGDSGLENARVQVLRTDFTSSKSKAGGLLGR